MKPAVSYVMRFTTEENREPVQTPFASESDARLAWLDVLRVAETGKLPWASLTWLKVQVPEMSKLLWADVYRTNGSHQTRTRCEWSHGGAGFRDITREHWEETRAIVEKLHAAAPAGFGAAVVPQLHERDPPRWDVLFSGGQTTHRIGVAVSTGQRILMHWDGYLPPRKVEAGTVEASP